MRLAQRVISDDLILDASEREIDDKAVMIIAKRQPMAVDLREIIGSIRISADLERVGDLGKNIAKRCCRRFGITPAGQALSRA
jgi:phosphate transport system protein